MYFYDFLTGRGGPVTAEEGEPAAEPTRMLFYFVANILAFGLLVWCCFFVVFVRFRCAF